MNASWGGRKEKKSLNSFYLNILARIIIVVSCVSFTSAFARTAFTVHIRAVPDDQPIAGIEVTFTDTQGRKISVVSDFNGNTPATLDDGQYIVTVQGLYNGQPVAFEPFYANGYEVQSFVGLSTFTLTIDPMGTVVHALERDWAGPSQEHDATAALAPPAMGTSLAQQRDATAVAVLPTDETSDRSSPIIAPPPTATVWDISSESTAIPVPAGNAPQPLSDIQPITANPDSDGVIAFTATPNYQPNIPVKHDDSSKQSARWVWLMVGILAGLGVWLLVYRARRIA